MPPPDAPLVSVLVTAYRHEDYVAEALESVVTQECAFAYEVLVGDDASPDGTRDVIRAYGAAHPELVKLHLPPERLGHDGRALFSELFERARGRYIAWLDGDDYWTSPGKLQRQVAHLEQRPGCAMVFHNALRHLEGAGLPDRRFNRARRERRIGSHELLRHNLVAALSPMFRRTAIEPLPSWYVDCPWGDWPLYLLASQRGTIDYLPDVMGVYRIHARGMYTAMERLEVLRRNTLFYEQVCTILPPRDRRRGRQMLAASWAARALAHLALGEVASARECVGRCLRLSPAGLGPAVRAEAQRMLVAAIASRRRSAV
jgi:glycosyltransferase involved in cell wall biosynthesis